MKTTLNKKQIKNSKKQPNTSTLMSELAQKLRIEWCGAKAIDKIVEEAKIKKLAKEADVKVQEELRIKKLRALCNDNLDLKIQSIEQAILNDQVKINVSFDPSYSVKEFKSENLPETWKILIEEAKKRNIKIKIDTEILSAPSHFSISRDYAAIKLVIDLEDYKIA
jgi:transcriptional regulator